MSNKIPANIEEEFAEFLVKGKTWTSEKKVEWAKVKTFDLTKELIVFDLGILAFLAAANSLYNLVAWLFVGAGLASLSLLLAFTYIWRVSTENINYLQAKYDAIDESLKKLENSYADAYQHYEKRLSFIENKLREKEEVWDCLQKLSFLLFFSSVLVSFLGLLL